MLELRVRRRLGGFLLEADLAVPPASVTVLVGESGSGKTTLLELAAGLLEPDEGRIVLGGRTLADTSARVFVPAEERPVGYVAQDYALFPHLSVRENVAFGLRASRRPGAEVRRRVDRALERFGLTDFSARRPHQLSGGQRQRVALARALVLEPEVLLLDEPLSALDLVTRKSVRGELRRTLEGLACVTLYVTHHPVEALAFGDQIAVLEAGRLSQVGTGADFVRHPRSAYVAEFLGVNLLEGEVREPGERGIARLECDGGALSVPDPGRTGPARFVVHPHDIVLSLQPPDGSARNVLRGVVEELVPEPPSGDRVRVLLSTRPALAAQLTRDSVEALALRPGREVYASFKALSLEVVPPV